MELQLRFYSRFHICRGDGSEKRRQFSPLMRLPSTSGCLFFSSKTRVFCCCLLTGFTRAQPAQSFPPRQTFSSSRAAFPSAQLLLTANVGCNHVSDALTCFSDRFRPLLNIVTIARFLHLDSNASWDRWRSIRALPRASPPLPTRYLSPTSDSYTLLLDKFSLKQAAKPSSVLPAHRLPQHFTTNLINITAVDLYF